MSLYILIRDLRLNLDKSTSIVTRYSIEEIINILEEIEKEIEKNKNEIILIKEHLKYLDIYLKRIE